jgi:hypothetical protein
MVKARRRDACSKVRKPELLTTVRCNGTLAYSVLFSDARTFVRALECKTVSCAWFKRARFGSSRQFAAFAVRAPCLAHTSGPRPLLSFEKSATRCSQNRRDHMSCTDYTLRTWRTQPLGGASALLRTMQARFRVLSPHAITRDSPQEPETARNKFIAPKKARASEWGHPVRDWSVSFLS